MTRHFPKLFVVALIAMSLSLPAFAVSTSSSSAAAAESTSVPGDVSVSEAVNDFKSLSRKERRDRVKEAKKEVKKFKEERKNGAEPSTNTLLLVLIAILLPPLAVYLHQGEINGKFWLSLLLTLLFYVPGLIYSLIVILGDE